MFLVELRSVVIYSLIRENKGLVFFSILYHMFLLIRLQRFILSIFYYDVIRYQGKSIILDPIPAFYIQFRD